MRGLRRLIERFKMSDLTTREIDNRFDTRINVWGRITIGFGLVVSLAGPIYLFTVEGLWPGWTPILTSMIAIAVIFGANWVVEPATYFPMLGVAGTYQAWLVGNISNKLLPAAVIAQAATRTEPGTRRGELVSVAAISGAVIVHITSMVIFVAIAGNYIVSVLPASVSAAFDYILPAIMGAVFIQLAFALKDLVTTLAALVGGALVVFALLPLIASFTAFALPIVVIISVTTAILRGKKNAQKGPGLVGEA